MCHHTVVGVRLGLLDHQDRDLLREAGERVVLVLLAILDLWRGPAPPPTAAHERQRRSSCTAGGGETEGSTAGEKAVGRLSLLDERNEVIRPDVFVAMSIDDLKSDPVDLLHRHVGPDIIHPTIATERPSANTRHRKQAISIVVAHSLDQEVVLLDHVLLGDLQPRAGWRQHAAIGVAAEVAAPSGFEKTSGHRMPHARHSTNTRVISTSSNTNPTSNCEMAVTPHRYTVGCTSRGTLKRHTCEKSCSSSCCSIGTDAPALRTDAFSIQQLRILPKQPL